MQVSKNHNFSKRCAPFFIFGYFLLAFLGINATPIKGVVLDSDSKEPLPYVNIWIKGTTTGSITNINGEFSIDQEFSSDDIIVFSFLGYKDYETNNVSISGKDICTIYLTKENISIAEVNVKPDNSYALSIIKKVVQNRKRNNPDNFEEIEYKQYMRKSIFLSNLKNDIAKKKAFHDVSEAFIIQSDSTVAMPIFFSEDYLAHSLSTDKNTSEAILTKSECVMPQLQSIIDMIVSKKISTDINFYNNQINIMSRGFPSPISWNNQLYYNTYLTDSVHRDGMKLLRFDYYPKSYRSTSFKGYFWIDSETFALTEIHAILPTTANVNFVNGFEAHVYYQAIAGKKWFYKGQKINSKLALSKSDEEEGKKRFNISVQNILDYHDIITPENEIEKIQRTQINKKLSTEEQLNSLPKIPYDSLEIAAFEGIKKLKQNKTIKHIARFSDMTLNGYYNLNKFDLGPYMDIYRKNAIEGDRFTLPIRTGEKMFKNFSLGGYIGYGFKSEEFKYGAKINYQLPLERRTILTLKYDDDYYALTNDKFIEFIRENPYEAGSGNVTSSITTRVPNPCMLNQQKFSISIEHQLAKDIGITIKPFYHRNYSNKNVLFTQNGFASKSFNNYGVMANVRFSFGQAFDEGYFYRVYYGNQKPVIHLSTIVAKASFTNELGTVTKPYYNLNATMKNRVDFGPVYMRMLLNVGYIGGDVPYPLLHLSRGTQDLGFARYHYNLLHNSSFIADLYSNAHFSLNGGGILFGKLPGIKKLSLRETVSFKSYWGQLKGDHASVMDIPDYLQKPFSTPYMELGLGVSNIFRVLRVEYTRRLNNDKLYDQFSSKHGVRLRLEVSF